MEEVATCFVSPNSGRKLCAWAKSRWSVGGGFNYSQSYDDLPAPHTQVIVVVKFGEKIDEQRQVKPNNFVLTAYMK